MGVILVETDVLYLNRLEPLLIINYNIYNWRSDVTDVSWRKK